MKREELDDWLIEKELSAITLDDLDEAMIGIVWVDFKVAVVYSMEKIIEVFMKRDGMDRDEAQEYYEFNTVRGIEYSTFEYPSPILMESIDA